jgi:acyl-[acyl-carrier-protein]-phospholipid O-acyltransferase / long-chain-fatty-acid--[acyl-carrier-protein] ligase
MGISAGFFIVPLNALFQDLSPEKKRGNYWAAFNVLSNIAILLASLLLWLLNSWLGMPLKIIFILIGIITLFITKMCRLNDQKLPS